MAANQTQPDYVSGYDADHLLRDQVEHLGNLPAMPEMAQRLLSLRSNPYADVDDLARVVEIDPSLSAQIVRYARSPLFCYRGRVDSVQSAISRVLGYEPVMNIALGIATASAFRIPADGPLGVRAIWHDAVFCAALCQALISAMPFGQRPRAGLTYLSGLLHNFGVVVLGEILPESHQMLNQEMERSGDDLLTVEDRLDVINHCVAGGWLMSGWRMPGEVVSAVAEHHHEEYDGAHSVYPNLVLIANRLLHAHEIGEATGSDLPEPLLERLGLHEEQARQVAQKVIDGRDELDEMISGMVEAGVR